MDWHNALSSLVISSLVTSLHHALYIRPAQLKIKQHDSAGQAAQAALQAAGAAVDAAQPVIDAGVAQAAGHDKLDPHESGQPG